ncbi:MAG: amidohydrolase family protein, partial [Candidatus Binataceae bacterium]
HAVVFIHPTSPACWEQTALGYPRPMIEFMFDSTRAVVNLIMSGTVERCPNVRIIVPHAGGTLPFLARRIAAIAELFVEKGRRPPAGMAAYLKRLYYDLAASTGTNALAPLMEMADSSRILFGSDAPFTPEAVIERQINELKNSALIESGDFRQIERGNGAALFPRLSLKPVGTGNSE